MVRYTIEEAFNEFQRVRQVPDMDEEARRDELRTLASQIEDLLPDQPEQVQKSIRAMLYHYGLRPERRSGDDRREGQQAAPVEHRRSDDRRQEWNPLHPQEDEA